MFEDLLEGDAILGRELGIGQVEQEDGVRTRRAKPRHLVEGHGRAGRIGGRRDRDQVRIAGRLGDRVDRNRTIQPRHRTNLGTGRLAEVSEHRKGRIGDDHGGVRTEHRTTDAVDRVVTARGRDDPGRIDPLPGRNGAFQRGPIRIPRRIDEHLLESHRQHGTTDALVRVEPKVDRPSERIAAERRFGDAGHGLDHGITCLGSLTTRSVPPAARTRPMSSGKPSRGTAARTA